MFALTVRNFHGRILDCGADPASLNAEATGEGQEVVSCDPFYRFSAAQIRGRVRDSVTPLTYARKNRDRCVWDGRGVSPERVREVRSATMARFLEGFRKGLKQDSYRTAALPAGTLPMAGSI